MILQRTTTYIASKGKFTVDDWQVAAQPETNVSISIVTDAVDPIKAARAKDEVEYIDSINLTVEVRAC